MRFLPSIGGRETKSPMGDLEYKDAQTRRASQGRGYTYANQPYDPPGPDIDRLVRDGYEKVIWAFRAIDAIADKMSDWPINIMEGTAPDWRVVKDDPLGPLLNEYANVIERQAKYFRYRLVSQLLLSKRGVFVEVVVDRLGRPKHLNLLPPAHTRPVPDPDNFISKFRVELPGAREKQPWVDLDPYVPEDRKGGVIWIRKPHPTDTYSSVTPLEAAGISLDLDFYARLYNLNFLRNDGRAGQLVAVKGGLSPEDAQELKARFQPGMAGAGRTTVIEADSVSVQDTATTPRDAQYAELRSITKDDILLALGTPESVLGNASGRTFDNADAEKENWLDVTVLPLSTVVEAGFDPLTKGGWGDDRRVKHDVSQEPVLRRRFQKMVEEARKDHAAGRITTDEFREIAEMDPIGRPGSKVLWLPGGKFAVGAEEDEKAAAELKPVGGPPTGPVAPGGEQPGGGVEGFDAELDAILAGGQPDGSGLGPAVPTAITTAGADLGLETKAYNPKQPRYPLSHPQGGQFMDAGDTALWLAGKPLKDGTLPGAVADPNPDSSDSPSRTVGGGGGAARFLGHADPAVRAAAYMLTYPQGYAYARVLGAPAAVPVNNPKATKLVSLRKGDVVSYSGGPGMPPVPAGATGEWTIASAARRANGRIELELVDVNGVTTTVTAGGQQTLFAPARTPHPTKVADAKRTLAAAARAMVAARAAAPAPAAPAAAPTAGTIGPFPTAAPGSYEHIALGGRLIVDATGGGIYHPGAGGTAVTWTAATVASQLTSSVTGPAWRAAPAAASASASLLAQNQKDFPVGTAVSVAVTGAQGTSVVNGTVTGHNRGFINVDTGAAGMGTVSVARKDVARLATAATPAAAPAFGTPLPTTPGWYSMPNSSLLMEVTASGDVWLRPSSGQGGAVIKPGSARYNQAMMRTWTPTPAPTPPPPAAPASPRRPVIGDTGPFTAAHYGTYESPNGELYVDQNGAGVAIDKVTGTRQALVPAVVATMLTAPGSAQWTFRASSFSPPAAAPPPAAPAPAVPTYNLPAPNPGELIYVETRTGKHAYVDPNTGRMDVYDSQGNKASTSATAAQLAAGRGAWQRIAAPSTGPVPPGSPAAKKAAAAPAAPAPAPAAPAPPLRGAPPLTPAMLAALAQGAGPTGPFHAIYSADYDDGQGEVMTVLPSGAGTITGANGLLRPVSAPQVVAALQTSQTANLWRMVSAPGVASAAQTATANPVQAPAPAAPNPIAAAVAAGSPLTAPTPAPVQAAARVQRTPAPSPAPAGSSAAATVLQAGVPTITVSRGWTVSGAQAGSNPAAMMTDPSGTQHYVKSQDAKHADNEVAAAMIYTAAGVHVPRVRRANIAPGSFGAQLAGADGIASEVVTSTPDMSARMKSDPKFRDAVLEDFAVHAWLGNWDAVENNNTARDRQGRPVTIDVGGSLAFRARGTKRLLDDKVTELQSMRRQSNTAGNTFKQLTPDHTDARFVAGVERIAAITPTQLRALVDMAMPSFSVRERKALVDKLLSRRAHLAGEARVTLPENVAPKPAAAAAPAVPNAPAAPPAPSPAGGSVGNTPQPTLGGKTPNDLLVPPAGYPYPVVAGAPVAFSVGPAPKPIKATSLRKGDVISRSGAAVTVVSVDRSTGTVTAQDDNGATVMVPAPSGTHLALARTEHPTKVAEARRLLAGGGAPAPAAPAAAPVQLTTPAVAHGIGGPGTQAARAYGTAQAGGYLPIPGQTYANTSGDVFVVHSDGSGTMTNAMGVATSLVEADVENLLAPGTGYVPVGPRLTTSTFSITIGRHATPNGDVLDVMPDGSGLLTPAAGNPVRINENAVDALINMANPAAAYAFGHQGPSPQAASATAGPSSSAVPVPTPTGPTAPPAGGWVAAGQAVPGAVFVDPRNGDTLTIGPRGGGKITFAAGQTRNMSAASTQSQLRKASSRWHLQSPGATGASTAPAAGLAPAFQAPAGVGVTPAAPGAFVPIVGQPAAVVAGRLQTGMSFINPKNGNRMVVNSAGDVEWVAGPKSRAQTRSRTYAPGKGARLLANPTNNYVTEAGPDIDVPGVIAAAAAKRAARQLPPPGTPVVGTPPVGKSYPPAATGSLVSVTAANLSRGQTIRVGTEDWVVTEVVSTGAGGRQVWGYRPGVDDPNTVTQDAATKVWRQGVQIPSIRSSRATVQVVTPTAAPATNVPSAGKARQFDPALPAPTTTIAGAPATGGTYAFVAQQVPANTVVAGDVITLRNRESEGSFVVTRVGQDHKGREAVYGYNGTLADAQGGTPLPEEKLFLTNPGSAMRQVGVQVNGATPPIPEVPRPTPPRADAGIERNDISDATSQAKVRDIMGGGVQGHAAGAARVGNAKMGHLLELRGYNAHPDVISDAEMDQFIADGEIELFRGMRNGTAGDVAEAFRSGKNYPGGLGGAMYGLGAYAAYGTTSGGSSGHFHGKNTGLDFVKDSYAGASDGVVLRMTIKPDARVGEFSALRDAMVAEARTNPVVKAITDNGGRYGYTDLDAAVGFYAVYKGYDVIRKSGAYRTGASGNTWDAGFVVLLNRSAVRVSEKNYVAPSRVRSAPGGGAPPPVAWTSLRVQMPRRGKHENGVDDKTVRGEP